MYNPRLILSFLHDVVSSSPLVKKCFKCICRDRNKLQGKKTLRNTNMWRLKGKFQNTFKDTCIKLEKKIRWTKRTIIIQNAITITQQWQGSPCMFSFISGLSVTFYSFTLSSKSSTFSLSMQSQPHQPTTGSSQVYRGLLFIMSVKQPLFLVIKYLVAVI